MDNPISFESRTSRFGIPFLFTGQAQKEFYINEAYALLDALLHPTVNGLANTPPASPMEGDCWIVGPTPTDEWAGHAGQFTCFQTSSWLFVDPCDGMQVFDRASRTKIRYQEIWHQSPSIAPPAEGSVVDVEARAVITELLRALTSTGQLAPST